MLLAELARARAAEAERRREETNRVLAELRELSTEHDRMEAEAIEAGALRRSDELKTALLRSVSHDLRTPLTSMIAAGAALDSPSISAEERHELSEGVVGEGQRALAPGRTCSTSRGCNRATRPRGASPSTSPASSRRRGSRSGRGRSRSSSTSTRRRRRCSPTRCSSSAPSPTCSKTGSGMVAGVRCSCARARPTGGSSSGSSTKAPGIPESERQRIFEPFYRRQGSNGGFGLGLAIAKGFVEANGGEIAVESAPGQGSTFVVSFPLGDRER